jgi:hypothetical protein
LDLSGIFVLRCFITRNGFALQVDRNRAGVLPSFSLSCERKRIDEQLNIVESFFNGSVGEYGYRGSACRHDNAQEIPHMHRVMTEKFKAFCTGSLRIVPALYFLAVMITVSFSQPSQQNDVRLSGKQLKKKIVVIGKQIDSIAYIRDQLLRDSLQIAAKIGRDRTQMSLAIRQIEDQIRRCDTTISLASTRKAGDAIAGNQKITEKENDIQDMMRKKKEIDTRKLNAENETDAAVAERRRIIESAQAAQNRYERLRTPYEEAVKSAETGGSQVKEEYQILLALRKQLEMNRLVAQVRDSLDNAIQLQAMRKKGAKKLVDRWEYVLDSINSRQDALRNKYPAISHRENLLPGMTLAQKILAADSEIARVEKTIQTGSVPSDRARNQLLAFERSNPPPPPPSSEKLARLDSLIAGKKRDLFRMADISDSLGMRIEEARNFIKSLSAPTQYVQDDDDAQLAAKRKERSTLASTRIRMVEDSVRRNSENESSLQRITGDIALLNNRLAALQNEQAQLQSVTEEPKRQSLLSKLNPIKDYYSERVTEPEPETVSEDEVLYFQEQQKLAALIKARDYAAQDVANAEKIIVEKRREIYLQDKLIEEKKNELDRLARSQKKDLGMGGTSSPLVQDARAKEIAQRRLEEIYVLLNNNAISTAVQRFRQLRPFLKAKLDPEAFQTLVMMLEQMGAVLQ